MLSRTLPQASLYLQSGRGYSTAAGTLPFPPTTLIESLRFLRDCLTHSAGATEEQKLTNQTLAPIAKYLLRLASEKGWVLTSQSVNLIGRD